MADLPFDLELSTDASCYLHRGTMTSSDADQLAVEHVVGLEFPP